MSSAFLGEKQILILEILASFTLWCETQTADILFWLLFLKLSLVVSVKECLKKRRLVQTL